MLENFKVREETSLEDLQEFMKNNNIKETDLIVGDWFIREVLQRKNKGLTLHILSLAEIEGKLNWSDKIFGALFDFWEVDIVKRFINLIPKTTISKFDILFYYAKRRHASKKLKFLLDNGFYSNEANGDFNTIMHKATEVSVKYLKIFVKQGTDVNAVNIYGQVPLKISLNRTDKEKTQFLIVNGARITDAVVDDKNGIEYLATKGLMELFLKDILHCLNEEEKNLYEENKVLEMLNSAQREEEEERTKREEWWKQL